MAIVMDWSNGMQIDYKTYIKDLEQEAVRAVEVCIKKARQPGHEDRQGYFEALASAPTLVRYFFCKDRAYFDYEPVAEFIKDKIRDCIGLVNDYRYAWDQHLEFARARGYLFALRLLRKHAARTIHVVPMRELQAPEEVTVIWHRS